MILGLKVQMITTCTYKKQNNFKTNFQGVKVSIEYFEELTVEVVYKQNNLNFMNSIHNFDIYTSP